MARFRNTDDPWVAELFSFVLQNPVGEYADVTITDRTFPSVKVNKTKDHYDVEVKLSRVTRRRLSYTFQGVVTKNEHLNY